MDKFKNFIDEFQNFGNEVDNKISFLEELLDALKRTKVALNNRIAHGSTNAPLRSVNNEEQKEISDSEYPKRKKLYDRVLYLINKENRALKFSEIVDLFIIHEGPKTKAKASLSTTLNRIIKLGVLAGCKYNNDKKLMFYLKSEWKNENKTDIAAQYYPTESLRDIPPEKLVPEKIVWK